MRRPRSAKPRAGFFGRLAQFCAVNHVLVLVFMFVAASMAAGLSVANLKGEMKAPAEVILDPATQAAQQQLESNFPGIEKTFLIRIDAGQEGRARQLAIDLAARLGARSDLFASSFVPGTGGFYEKYGFLFRSAEDIDARVRLALRMQPVFKALGAAPDIAGLASLVSQIGNAVAQGRSPPGLENLLLSAAASVAGEIRGQSRPIPWRQLAGLSASIEGRRWFVIAAPVAGRERQAAAVALAAAAEIPGATVALPQLSPDTPDAVVRDVVVPGVLMALLAIILLGVGLGAARFWLPVALSVLITTCLTAAAAWFPGVAPQPLGLPFAIMCVVPAVLFSVIFVLAHVQWRTEGYGPLAATMLAARQRGGLLLLLGLIAEIIWVVWQFRLMPALGQQALTAALAVPIAWVLSLTLVPAALAALDDGGYLDVHWFDDLVANSVDDAVRNLLHVVALIIVATAVFCAVFVPTLRFGSAPAPIIDEAALTTPVARNAIHALSEAGEPARALAAAIAQLPETGAIRTIEQFLPADVPNKQAKLRALTGYLAGVPTPRELASQAAMATSLAALRSDLEEIVADPQSSPELRAAASSLGQAIGEFSGADLPDPARVSALEGALFGGLGDLSWAADQLARLDQPGIESLDADMRRRFVSESGLWRIEVLPKPGVAPLALAKSVRALQQNVAGAAITALVEGDAIRVQAIAALTIMFASLAALTLLYLRNVGDWLLTFLPVGLGLCLAAAFVTATGQLVATATLAAAMVAMAMCLASSLILVMDDAGASRAPPTHFRTAFLPMIVVFGTAAPLMISSVADVAKFGANLTLFAAIAIILVTFVIPQASALRRG